MEKLNRGRSSRAHGARLLIVLINHSTGVTQLHKMRGTCDAIPRNQKVNKSWWSGCRPSNRLQLRLPMGSVAFCHVSVSRILNATGSIKPNRLKMFRILTHVSRKKSFSFLTDGVTIRFNVFIQRSTNVNKFRFHELVINECNIKFVERWKQTVSMITYDAFLIEILGHLLHDYYPYEFMETYFLFFFSSFLSWLRNSRVKHDE